MSAIERERREESRFMAERATPRSEQQRSAWGSLEMSIQTVPNLCGRPRPGKGACWRKAGHEGSCP